MDWGTIIPVLVGSAVALVTSISAEYMKYRQTTVAAARERENVVRQQSREGLHTLVMQVQDSLSKMILVAHKMADAAVGVEEEASLRGQFRDVTLDLARLVSRLPEKPWRESVSNAVKLANQAVEGASDEESDAVWAQAAQRYEEALDGVAEPLQKFYKLAINGTRP